jgi:hypothetical protein
MRHLKEPLARAGLPDTLPGRREADRRIRVGLGMVEADCPDVWRTVKTLEPAKIEAMLRAEG